MCSNLGSKCAPFSRSCANSLLLLGFSFCLAQVQMSTGAISALTKPRICFLPPETGPCRAAFRRWYFNSTANECEEFIFGGCDGNENNFETEAKCNETCKSSISDSMQNTIQTYFELVHNGVTPEKPVPFFPQPGRFRRNVVPQNPSKRKVDKLNGNAASLGISGHDLEPYFTTGKLRSRNKRSLTSDHVSEDDKLSDPNPKKENVLRTSQPIRYSAIHAKRPFNDSRESVLRPRTDKNHNKGTVQPTPASDSGFNQSKVNDSQANKSDTQKSLHQNRIPNEKEKRPSSEIQSGGDKTRHEKGQVLRKKTGNEHIENEKSRTREKEQENDQDSDNETGDEDENEEDGPLREHESKPKNEHEKSPNFNRETGDNDNGNDDVDDIGKEETPESSRRGQPKGDDHRMDLLSDPNPKKENVLRTSQPIRYSTIHAKRPFNDSRESVLRARTDKNHYKGTVLPTPASDSGFNQSKVNDSQANKSGTQKSLHQNRNPNEKEKGPNFEIENGDHKTRHETGQVLRKKTGNEHIENEKSYTKAKEEDNKNEQGPTSGIEAGFNEATLEKHPLLRKKTKNEDTENEKSRRREKEQEDGQDSDNKTGDEDENEEDGPFREHESKPKNEHEKSPNFNRETGDNDNGKEDVDNIGKGETPESSRRGQPKGDDHRMDLHPNYEKKSFYGGSDGYEHQSSHFAGFFLTSIVMVFAVYVVYHNRQKIVAIIIEGRNDSGSRRRGYRKLETNVEEAMASMKNSDVTYVY